MKISQGNNKCFLVDIPVFGNSLTAFGVGSNKFFTNITRRFVERETPTRIPKLLANTYTHTTLTHLHCNSKGFHIKAKSYCTERFLCNAGWQAGGRSVGGTKHTLFTYLAMTVS